MTTRTADRTSLLLAPRSIGELLSDAAALLRQRLAPIVVMALPFCVVELLCREGAQALFARALFLMGPNGDMAPEQLPEIGGMMAGYSGLLFASFAVTQLLGGSAVLASSGALFGQRLTPAQLILGGLKKAAAVLVTLLLWSAALFALAIVLPGVVLGLLVAGAVALSPPAAVVVGIIGMLLWLAWMVLVIVVLALRWALWLQAVVLEGLSGPRALARSTELMAARGGGFAQSPKFRLSILLLVYMAVASTLQSLFAMPMLIQGVTQQPMFSDVSLWSMPLGWMIPLAALQVATNAILMPFSGVLSTLFYFDLRVRYEGFDLGDDDEAG